MNPILLGVCLLVAVIAGAWVGQRAKSLSERKPKSLAGRAKDLAARRVGGLFRSIVGRGGDEPDEPE